MMISLTCCTPPLLPDTAAMYSIIFLAASAIERGEMQKRHKPMLLRNGDGGGGGTPVGAPKIRGEKKKRSPPNPKKKKKKKKKGRTGLAGTRLARDDDALLLLVRLDVVVGVLGDRVNVRRELDPLLAAVLVDVLGSVDAGVAERVDRDQHLADVGVNQVRHVAKDSGIGGGKKRQDQGRDGSCSEEKENKRERAIVGNKIFRSVSGFLIRSVVRQRIKSVPSAGIITPKELRASREGGRQHTRRLNTVTASNDTIGKIPYRSLRLAAIASLEIWPSMHMSSTPTTRIWDCR